MTLSNILATSDTFYFLSFNVLFYTPKMLKVTVYLFFLPDTNRPMNLTPKQPYFKIGAKDALEILCKQLQCQKPWFLWKKIGQEILIFKLNIVWHKATSLGYSVSIQLTLNATIVTKCETGDLRRKKENYSLFIFCLWPPTISNTKRPEHHHSSMLYFKLLHHVTHLACCVPQRKFSWKQNVFG